MKTLTNASVGVKVAMSPLTAILCLLAVAALGLWTTRNLTGTLRHLHDRTLPSLQTMAELQRGIASAFAETNQSLAWTGGEFPAQRIEALDKALSGRLASLEKLIAAHVQEPGRDGESKQRMQAMQKAFGEFKRAALDALDMKSTGLVTAATFVQNVEDTYRKLDGLIEAQAVALRGAAASHVEESAGAASTKSWAIAAAALIAVLAAAAVGWWSARLIVRPLRDAQRLATDVALGDLTVRRLAASDDETGRVLAALGEVTRNLNGIVAEIRGSATQIDSASNEIASGNADLSLRTESAASALQEAAAAVEELATTIRHSAENAREANTMAREASMVAREGGQMVTEVVQTMEAINGQANKVGEIIGTIDGIAFQTNILALNAAVEAARAGEHGRGFSVVASEVRSLAQRSAESAREIRTLISSSVDQIDAGAGKVQTAGRTMMRIVDAIGRVSQTVEDISRAADEQAQGIAQVNQTVAEMDRSTQQNAAMVEQASAAAESLRQQAARLMQSLERFRIA